MLQKFRSIIHFSEIINSELEHSSQLNHSLPANSLIAHLDNLISVISVISMISVISLISMISMISMISGGKIPQLQLETFINFLSKLYDRHSYRL